MLEKHIKVFKSNKRGPEEALQAQENVEPVFDWDRYPLEPEGQQRQAQTYDCQEKGGYSNEV